MSARRGFTLVEVLAATALVAVLAGTCVPFMVRAMRALEAPESSFELWELAELADAAVEQSSESGSPFDATEDSTIEWPDTVGRPSVHVRRVVGEESSYEWLLFTCDGQAVARWVTLADDAEAAP